ncbi:MAG: hypothetical protein ABSF38_00325 [Verrucomicrobiota bacterium]|jgi:uncharacterized protein YceK
MKLQPIIALLVLSGCSIVGAQEISSNSPPRFIPGSYSGYVQIGMNAQEWETFHKAGSNYVDNLLKDLPAHFYNAYTLHQLGDNGVTFSREQVDLLFENLVHPGQTNVVDQQWAEEQIRETVCNIFGISFFEGENNWPTKPEEIRRPYTETWEKFWLQNRARYGKELPLVINDLSLAAKMVANDNDEGVEITIHNHGSVDWKFFTEVAGRIQSKEAQNPNTGGSDYHWPGFSIYADGHEERPEIPAAYYGFYMGPHDSMPSPDSGRPVHLDRIMIPQGQSYVYTMKLKEAFPQLSDRHYKNLVVRYQYGLYGTHKDDAVWRGELRSMPINLKSLPWSAEGGR